MKNNNSKKCCEGCKKGKEGNNAECKAKKIVLEKQLKRIEKHI